MRGKQDKQESEQERQERQMEHEGDVVEDMVKAKAIAEKLFGANGNHTRATEEIYDYLLSTDNEEAFAGDLKRTIENAKTIYGETPTVEQVFGLFERIFVVDAD